MTTEETGPISREENIPDTKTHLIIIIGNTEHKRRAM